MNGETMFTDENPASIILILLTNTGTTAVFENIDGVNTTNPGYAITVSAEVGGTSGPGTYYDLGNNQGTINGIDTDFVSYGRDALDVFIGPFDPRTFTQTGTVTAANYAFYMPFTVNRPVTVTGARTYIAVQSGNIDVGIVTTAGVRMTSTGGIACPAVGERTVTFTAPVTLYPGILYYLTFVADNTTVALAIKNGVIATSGYEGAGMYPLPASGMSPPGNPALENFMWVLTE
jgi:hypothetical protein